MVTADRSSGNQEGYVTKLPHLAQFLPILAGRALLTVTVAGAMTSTTFLIDDYYADPSRLQIRRLQAAFMGFGGVVFLAVGGLLADASWRLLGGCQGRYEVAPARLEYKGGPRNAAGCRRKGPPRGRQGDGELRRRFLGR